MKSSHARLDLASDPITFIAVGVALAEQSGAADGEHRSDLDVFEGRLRDTAPQLLKSFDDEALPAVRKRFILDILERRLNWLRSVL